ncbi:MAG: DUF29 domain-containing protein [Candidatus Binataceae bacterium]
MANIQAALRNRNTTSTLDWDRVAEELEAMAAREDISDLLEESPGIFQGKIDEVVAQCYGRARAAASDETGMPLSAFPDACPRSFDQIMIDDFFADAPQLR